MDVLMILTGVCLAIVFASFVGYSYMTNSIIKDQEKEKAKLNAKFVKLQAELNRTKRKTDCRKAPKIIEIHDNRIEEKNVPTFGDI